MTTQEYISATNNIKENYLKEISKAKKKDLVNISNKYYNELCNLEVNSRAAEHKRKGMMAMLYCHERKGE